jgi:hypothetical protein
MLEFAFGEDMMSSTQMLKRPLKFKSGMISVEDAEHLGALVSDIDGILHHFFQKRQTMNQHFHIVLCDIHDCRENFFVKGTMEMGFSAMKCSYSTCFICARISGQKQHEPLYSPHPALSFVYC